ncbi:MAG: Na+/H+ antiporter subunit B [Phycisphaerales bacterium]
MTSLIFRTATAIILPVLLLFSIVVLFRGHNEPGGGFVGGLVAASAFALFAMAHGTEGARRMLRARLFTLLGTGLAVALGSAIFAMLFALPFMQGMWTSFGVPGLGEIKVGTPVVFDIGVYLTVMAVTLTFIFNLAET